ncbi:MAG TPA: hypothetical protein VES20_11410 [Bryobacteraceae bacterium]|nr:hypothetical protein [Bryobacteraceae bacterium]
MPEGLLVLPLTGGFLLIHLCHYFRFTAQRYDGYRLLLASAVAGILLLALGRLIVVIASAIPVLNAWAGNVWPAFSPFPHSDSCVWSLGLGPLVAAAVNLVYDKEAAKAREVSGSGILTQLLDKSAREKRLISITLDTRKWYVGYVSETPNFKLDEEHVRLLPLLSGYRDKDTLKAVRTTNYRELLKRTREDDLWITLPIAGLKSANFFDPERYEEFFAGGPEGPDGSASVDKLPEHLPRTP